MSDLVVQVDAQTVVLHEACTIGRAGTGIRTPDEYASPEHAALTPDGDGWTIEDLGSTNGTWLNGERIYGPRQVTKGDKVRVGRTTLTLVPAGGRTS